MTSGPTDWTSGERVFAPPSGTLDPEWLVPAVLETAPGHSPAQARDALVRGWAAIRSGDAPPQGTALADVAASVLSEAIRAFDA
ncbi:hypothetical protein [Actinotalea sp.]|uniref:hypothetical protein n=1 Tax=Actinotalea sp. TaxID=1872145 RepID=UPI00356A4A7F